MNLNNEHLKKDPYLVPQSYTDSLEERVRASLHKEESKRSSNMLMRLKPALMLALMFGLIGSLGYIASNITDKYIRESNPAEEDIFVLIEEGYLKSSFIYSYYDDIDVQKSLEQSMENNLEDEKINELLELTMAPQELLYYIEHEDKHNGYEY